MKTVFLDYFDDSEEYPDPTAAFLGSKLWEPDGPLEDPNILLSYISHSFLSGWINYVEIVQARVVKRYSEKLTPDEIVAAYVARPMLGPAANARVHTNFLRIGAGDDLESCDDAAILARDKSGRWWYFYYDQDVSDCQIGRFRTDDADTIVIERFEMHCRESAVIPNSAITGWRS